MRPSQRLAAFAALACAAALLGLALPASADEAGEEKAGEDLAQELRMLREEVARLRAALEQREQEIENLRGELAAMRRQAEEDEDEAKPPERITDRNLTLESVREHDYTGAQLLVDGFVVAMEAREGEYRAVVVAGGFDAGGLPALERRVSPTRNYPTYQIQVAVSGDAAAKLRPGIEQVRLLGQIGQISLEGAGVWFRYTGWSPDREFRTHHRRRPVITLSLEDAEVILRPGRQE